MGAGMMVVSVGLIVQSFNQVDLACDRERCVVTHSLPASRTETPLAGYRGAEKRIVSSGKSRSIQLTLIDESGSRRNLMSVDDRTGGPLAIEMQALLAGEREAVQHHEPRQPTLALIGALGLCFGGYWLQRGIRGWRSPPAPTPTPTISALPHDLTAAPTNRRMWLLVAAMVVISMVMSFVLSAQYPGGQPTTGRKLTIEATQLCEFEGRQVPPGTFNDVLVDPGEHVIRVWAPDAPGQWIERRFTVAPDGDTRFVCLPP